MKISTKGRYSLVFMLDMARHFGSEPVKVKDISARSGVSMKYMEQIVSVLNKAGFVRSVRGAQGGYLLTRNPEDYTVGQILRLSEGSLAPVACLENNTCEKRAKCVSVRLYEEINNAVNGVVDRITLADMLNWEKEDQDASGT
ncbi:MAG: RrF2 family transcriptional regulator [Oscillospiraceae bacterium]|nr:RrF2 family transcriptional regulator [Oscillospiraceae bacterium]